MKSLFSFSGRVGRLRYFCGGCLLPIALYIVACFFAVTTGEWINGFQDPSSANWLLCLCSVVFLALLLAALMIHISFQVRRFHDMDHRGWWFLLAGGLFIALLFWRGTDGMNRFGQNPRQNG